MNGELHYVISGAIACVVALIGALAKREFSRIDENFDRLFNKLDTKLDKVEYDKHHEKLERTFDEKCKERRASCDPCRKTVTGIQSDLDSAVGCINKYVNDCNI